ncbi:MAG TPA: hypothetical protein VM869_30495, partial [Enhygromyxa sp.]|nr:hypothetical protein [Enhygromyxa sp.]
MRAAAGLEMPAWICGALALQLVLLEGLMLKRLDTFALALVLSIMLARMLWSSLRTPSMAATAPGPRLPGEVHDLLALVDSLIDALERGNDRLFNHDMIQLSLALDRLGPEAQRYLDERGANRARLRHGLGWSEDARRIAADRRRAFHQELLRFGAAARGRPCGDPYRSRVSDGPLLLAVVRDRSLARVRRRCLLLLLCVAPIWASVSQMMAAVQTRRSRLCNPWGDNPNCGFELDLEVELQLLQMMLPRLDPWVLGTFAVALTPMVLLLAAHVAREAGWRSFAAALPAPSELPGVSSRLLARLRRRERASRGLWRALVGLACIATYGLLLVTHEWNRYDFTMVERVALIELVTLAVVLVPTLIGKWELGRERRRLQRRIDRAPQSAALLTELFELRHELEHAAPARGELLEQFARMLEQAQAIGRLSLEERERVVARLRAAAARGTALDRATRERLLLELRACE